MFDLAPSCVASPGAHLVLFYNDQNDLLSELVSYIEQAVRESANIILIATRDHRLALQAALGSRTDVDEGRVVILDAEQTLTLFMRDGYPDATRFAHTIGGLLEQYSSEIGELSLYGEMVALLWDQGNTDGALALEELWGQLLTGKPYRLLCAYPLQETLTQRPDGLAQIAHRHTSVHLGGLLNPVQA